MRVLVDECVPRARQRPIKGHQVQTVPEAGWAGKENGELLGLAQGCFDVFLPGDQNLQFQQKLLKSSIAVLLLIAPDNSIDAILPMIPEIEMALLTLGPGEIRIIGS